MRVLGIETATPYASVAVVGGDGLLGEVTALAPMRHLEWLMPAVERLLRDIHLERGAVEGVAVSQGPGGFTGLRIGIASAVAWSRATGAPLVGISTLQALASGVAGPGLIAPVLDAKRGEVAAALFRREEDLTLTRLRDDTVLPPRSLPAFLQPHEPIMLLGDGVGRYEEDIRELLPQARALPETFWAPRAALVAALGRARLAAGERDDPYRLQPVYGRRPYVEDERERHTNSRGVRRIS